MGRILVVEDEFLLADHIAELLENNGHEVIGPAGTLDEAVALASRAQIDAALLDVNIVGGPIDAVAEALADRGIPFFFVTAERREHLPSGFRDKGIVAKPFEDDRLIVRVGSLIAAEQASARLVESH